MSGRCPAVLRRGGDTIKKILIIKATCDPGLLSGAQRHRGKLFSELKQMSVIHKTLQPLPTKKKGKSCYHRISCSLFLP
jgi:hypothetical protein